MAEVSVAIADDNRQTLNLLGEILEKEDGIHVVGKADNGEDAYNMIVETNPEACGGYSHIWIRRRTWSRTWRPM